jgi:hypothetical protein
VFAQRYVFAQRACFYPKSAMRLSLSKLRQMTPRVLQIKKTIIFNP